MKFLAENWHLISFAGFVLVSILNRLTLHYDKHEGVKRWLTFASGLISFLTSKDVQSKLKLPLTPEKKEVQ